MAVPLLTGADLNNQKAVRMADPTAPTDGVNLQTLQNFIAGLAWKDEVRVATTTAGTLASSFANGQTVDGIVLATGDRVLIKDQAAAAENGIYTVNTAGAPTRATDANSTTKLNNATVSVTDGTTNGGKSFSQTTKNPTVGTSALVWAPFAVGITYTADGLGIELVGTQFQLELDGSSLSKSSAGVRVAAAFVTALAGAGLTESGGVLAVGSGNGIQVSADGINVDPSVVARKYVTNIGNGTLTTFSLAHGLGSQDLDVTVKEVSTGLVVFPDVTIPPAGSTVDLTFAVAPTTNQYRVIVCG